MMEPLEIEFCKDMWSDMDTRRSTRSMGELELDYPISVHFFNNDQGAIAFSRDPVHHKRSEHLASRHHFLRGKVEDKTTTLVHVFSAENIADLLTKSLPGPTFERL